MHFLDPNRPRLHGSDGLPLLQGVSSRTVLPCLHVSPRGLPEASLLEISVFLPSSYGGASRREILLELWEFPAFWQQWLDDPERVAQEKFGWTPPGPKAPSAPKAPSTKAPAVDLDLDDLLSGL